MTKRASSEASPASSLEIGVVRYEHAQRAAVYGLSDMLSVAAELHQRAAREHTDSVASEEPRLEVSHWVEGALTAPSRPLTALIAPPSLGHGPPRTLAPELRRWLEERHSEGTILCSVCVGTFLLADLGVLDGRPATTHWALKETFAERFPAVHLDTDRLLIDDGDIITAGGLMAWVDLALALVARFLGPSTMLATARHFIVDPGGREQRFYESFSPTLTHGDAAILKAQRWLQRHFSEDVTVEEMARQAGLGRRTFLRRFPRATGERPTAYVQQLRVSRARELLELSDQSQQEIAWAVGYEDPGAFRRVFDKHMGLSPAAYRRRFSASTSE